MELKTPIALVFALMAGMFFFAGAAFARKVNFGWGNQAAAE
jgi:hypothetical protein